MYLVKTKESCALKLIHFLEWSLHHVTPASSFTSPQTFQANVCTRHGNILPFRLLNFNGQWKCNTPFFNSSFSSGPGTHRHSPKDTDRLCGATNTLFRRLVAGLPPRRPGFYPGSLYVGFVVGKVALGEVFPPSTSVFLCQFHITGAPLHRNTGKKLIIFITYLNNKPQGCGASVASAAEPFTVKENPIQ